LTPRPRYSMLPVRSGGDLDTMANVRPATEEDIPRILELYDELAIRGEPKDTEPGPAPDKARRVFSEISADPRHEIFVAEDGGRVAGSIVLLVVPNLSHGGTPWAIAENLIVTEGQRRRGIGRMLLEYVIARAREKGCYKVQLWSSTSRKEAHGLYRSLGFEASAYGFRLYF
jgi:GNAT superfamily N-acetyltransferase